jgi:hypothetical protein
VSICKRTLLGDKTSFPVPGDVPLDPVVHRNPVDRSEGLRRGDDPLSTGSMLALDEYCDVLQNETVEPTRIPGATLD